MSAPKTLNGKIVLQVYMLDNSYKTLLIEPTSTVHDVCRMMAEKIGFSDPEEDSLCFGLCECHDGVTIQRSLPPDREVLAVMEAWFEKPDAKFIFQLKLYTETLVNSKDPKVIHMMFMQAVYNVITGTYPTTDKEAVALAALQFQAKFGQHNSASHKPGFLTNMIMEFIPGPHLDKKTVAVAEWEKLLFHKHAFSTVAAPREAYLELLKKREYYGAVLFAVKQRYDRALPKRLFMAIGRQGILLLKIPKSFTEGDLEVVARFNLADIYRWAYKTGTSFYFEIKMDGGESNPVYSFDTPEGKHMSDMLTDYAMALLREMGLNPDGTRRVRHKPGQQPEAAAAGAAAPAGPPPAEVLPTKDAMAASADTYTAVGGEAGALASAATRSGEASTEAAGAGAEATPEGDTPASGAAEEEEGGAIPVSPKKFGPGATEAPEAPPVEGEAAVEPFDKPLPADWVRVLDETTKEYYFFNSTTGESVWNYEDVPQAAAAPAE